MKKGDWIQFGILGVVSLIILGTVGLFVFDKWVGDKTVGEPQSIDIKPQTRDVAPQGELRIYYGGSKSEVRGEAMASSGRDHYYDHKESWHNAAYDRSLETIENTNTCTGLMNLFIENTGWHARPYLAEKIVEKCL